MKLKFYFKKLLFIHLGLLIGLTLSGQPITFAAFGDQADDDNLIDITNDCINDGAATFIDVEVSGLPILSGEFNLDQIFLYWQIDGILDVDLFIKSPSGTTVQLLGFGSWPNAAVGTGFDEQYILQNSQTLGNHDDPFGPNPCDPSEIRFRSNPFSSFDSAFLGEDPNGTWTFELCGFATSMILSDRMALTFRQSSAYFASFSIQTTNATSCNAADGSFSALALQGGGAQSGSTVYVNFDGQGWVSFNGDPCVQGGAFAFDVDNLPAGTYSVAITNDDGSGAPNLSTVTEYQISVAADNGAPQPFILCQPDIEVAIGTDQQGDVALIPPRIGDDCGFGIQYNGFLVIRPDGSQDGPFGWDPTVDDVPVYPMDQLGVYEIEWMAEPENGGVIACTQFITTTEDDPSFFGAAICAAPAPEQVFFCDLFQGIPAQTFDVAVSGLDNLNQDYGLSEIYISGIFNGPVDGYATLIDPSGNRYDLFAGGLSFPQYDGTVNGNFDVNFKSCSTTPAHDTNDPFMPNGFYRPITDLNAANSNLDPNGNWQLEVCGFTQFATWELACFQLKFDKLQPQIVNCPPNQTVELDASGNATFNVLEPDLSDDCEIVSEYVSITYSGGANDGNGGTFTEFFQIDSGTEYSYAVSGEGLVTFDWEIEDGSGNITTCQTVITATSSVGLDDLESVTSFTVSPSVTSDLVNIEMELNQTENVRLQILNAQGQLVKNMNLGNTSSVNQTIDLAGYTSGLYIINMHVGNKIAGEKIMKI